MERLPFNSRQNKPENLPQGGFLVWRMYANLMANAKHHLDPSLTKITVGKSGETIDWLAERVKVPFEDKIMVGYGPLQMMHIVAGGGVGFMKPFQALIDELEIDLTLETRATEILVDARGAVKGVKALKNGAEVTVLAKAVVVATGGYAYNPELTVRLDPEKKGTMGIGFPGSTGDGLVMANNVGAALSHTSSLMAVLKDYEIMSRHSGNSATANLSRFIAAPNCVLVGKDARRFVDEKSGGYMTQDLNALIFDQMRKDDLGYVWVISDAATLKSLNVKRGLGMEYISADTAEELARKTGLDPASLAKTIEAYNGYAKTGIDLEFKRDKPAPRVAPFVAVSVMPCEIITNGGVARNEKSEVIRADGLAIPGLYAAGEVTGGVHGGNRLGGNALADIVTFGRIAGRNAAAAALSR